MKKNKYLDLTNNKWKQSRKWQLVGMELLTRPYKKIVLIPAMIIAGLGIIPFLPFFVTIPLSLKILGRWG